MVMLMMLMMTVMMDMMVMSHCLLSLNMIFLVMTFMIHLPVDTLASESLAASPGLQFPPHSPPPPPSHHSPTASCAFPHLLLPSPPTASHAPSHLLPPISSQEQTSPSFPAAPSFSTDSRLVVPSSGLNPSSHGTCSPEHSHIINKLGSLEAMLVQNCDLPIQ